MKRRRDLSVQVNLILVSYLFHEQLQKIFEEEFTKCAKHSQLKQALKFSEDPRSGLLTHTHKHTHRNRDKERS